MCWCYWFRFTNEAIDEDPPGCVGATGLGSLMRQ